MTPSRAVGSLAAQAGVPIQTISRFMGHSSLTITMRYAHLFADDGRAAAKLLGGTLKLGVWGTSRGTKASDGESAIAAKSS